MQQLNRTTSFDTTHASDTIFNCDTNAAYLFLTKSCSRINGPFYISDHPPPTDTPKPKLNGPILIVCPTLKHLVALAAEAETGGMFLNRQKLSLSETPSLPCTNRNQKMETPSSQTAKQALEFSARL